MTCGILMLAAVSPLAGQAPDVPDSLSRKQDGPYFYRGLPYGSEAYYGPFAVLLNKGFAVSLMEGISRDLGDFPYGVDAVADAIAHPFAAIERGGGWGKLLKEEVLPLTLDPMEARWWTNYTGHLIEGGMHWRQLKEWYEHQGVPAAGLLSGVVTMAAAGLNEVYESQGATQGSAATVVDLYLFDLAGIALFSFDGVSRFFSHTLHGTLWTGQAAILVPAGETANNSSHVFFKIPWGVVPSTSIFLWSGVGGGIGLTLHRGNGLDVSVGAGTDARGRSVDPVTGVESATLTFGGGLWIDRHGSLLVNLHLSEVHHRMVRLNVYPGVLPGLGRELGFWMTLARDMEVRFGISSRHAFGIGLGFGS